MAGHRPVETSAGGGEHTQAISARSRLSRGKSRGKRDELQRTLAQFDRQRAILTQVITDLRQRLGDDPDMVPLKFAAADTRYCAETIRQWLIRGLVAAERRGGRWFVSCSSLAAHLDRQHTR